MATQLNDFDWSKYPVGRVSKYPWAEWLDGAAWRLVQGEDYNTKYFRQGAQRAGEKLGLKVRTADVGDGVVVIQAFNDGSK